VVPTNDNANTNVATMIGEKLVNQVNKFAGCNNIKGVAFLFPPKVFVLDEYGSIYTNQIL
jgi:hypothetical protein